MLSRVTGASSNWLCAGQEVFPAMLEAIAAARQSVRLETYIYSPGALGERFLEALVDAQEKGVQVRVLTDAFGSIDLPDSFWDSLRAAGGQVRQFNPFWPTRLGIRDHRKLLVCDERVAFVGGFNIASEYEGDGVTCGWCDIGLKIQGPLAAQLAVSFEEMFERADFRQRRFIRVRKTSAKRVVFAAREQLLLSGPGRGRNPIKRALRRDLKWASRVQIMMGYFLPTWRLRRQLVGVARRGGKLELLLPGKSDVPLSQLAGQSLYRRFLNAGAKIWEYEPQVLHAKLLIIDDVVYIGSANLDQRSLNINYELVVRFEGKEIAAQAREVFARNLRHSRAITAEAWRKSRSFWRRLKQKLAYFLLARLDPYLARLQWRRLAD